MGVDWTGVMQDKVCQLGHIIVKSRAFGITVHPLLPVTPFPVQWWGRLLVTAAAMQGLCMHSPQTMAVGTSPPLPHQPQPAQHTPGVLWPATQAHIECCPVSCPNSPGVKTQEQPERRKRKNPSKPQQIPHSLRVTPPTQASATLTKLTDAHTSDSPLRSKPSQKSTLPKGSERDQLPWPT